MAKNTHGLAWYAINANKLKCMPFLHLLGLIFKEENLIKDLFLIYLNLSPYPCQSIYYSLFAFSYTWLPLESAAVALELGFSMIVS